MWTGRVPRRFNGVALGGMTGAWRGLDLVLEGGDVPREWFNPFEAR